MEALKTIFGMPIHIDHSGVLKTKTVVPAPSTFLDEQHGNILFRILFGPPEPRTRIKIEDRIVMIGNNIVMGVDTYHVLDDGNRRGEDLRELLRPFV